MPLNIDKLMNWPAVEGEYCYEDQDTMLYALAVCMGGRPTDARELRFVFEPQLLALPTMAMVMGTRYPWLHEPDTGINLRKMLHGETSLTLHRQLPVRGCVTSRTSIAGIADRGADKGATVYFRRDVLDSVDGAPLATVSGCFVMRDGGGCGSAGTAPPAPRAIPDRSPDSVIDVPTLQQAALIYRLTGDRNPLHVDPALAQAAGFARPILHGACTYGNAGRILLSQLCEYDPARLKRMDARYSAPLYPGESLRMEIWNEGGGEHAFRCTAADRGVVVLNNGYAAVE